MTKKKPENEMSYDQKLKTLEALWDEVSQTLESATDLSAKTRQAESTSLIQSWIQHKDAEQKRPNEYSKR